MSKPSSYHKILVIQTAFIGDVVLATAVVEELHRALPSARIDFLLRKRNEGVFDGHPFIGKILSWDKSKRKYLNLFEIIKHVRSERYDLVVNLQRFFSTGLLMALSGAGERVCYKENPMSWLATLTVHYSIGRRTGEHEVSRMLRLVEFITHSTFSPPKIYINVKEKKVLGIEGRYITISPASAWFTKQFPKEKWLEMMDRVGEDTAIILLGGKNDRTLCEWLNTETKHKNTKVMAGDFSFLESAAIMKNAAMNFTNDSAPLHFASAVNAPVTTVFCSTVPEFGFTPLSSDSAVIETEISLDCRPCGLHGKKACPKGHFKCSEIPIDRLLDRLPQ